MADPQRFAVYSHADGCLSISGNDNNVAQYRRFTARKQRFTAPFGHDFPDLLEDLVDLALVVYAADRLTRGSAPRSVRNGNWQRRIEVHIPVSSPERWSQPSVGRQLCEALDFLTEDRWSFNFLPRKLARARHAIQGNIFPPGPDSRVALFSGGLDSLAGLASRLVEIKPQQRILVLTCATSSRFLKRQRNILQELNYRNGSRLVPVILPIRLHQDRRAYDLNEHSQRGRGFLFCMLGIVAALMAGARELEIYENGIGAINLPLSEAQLGAQNSRATHPVTLWKLEKFLHSLLDQTLSLRLPFLFSTKGQICASLRNSPFADLAVKSISCDGFPSRTPGPEHCGTCTSCLLRRQALWAGGFEADKQMGLYRRDVLTDLDAIPAPRAAPLWEMLDQVDRLERALESKIPWIDLSIEFPELREIAEVIENWMAPIGITEVQRRLVRLYRTYCDEWHYFPAWPIGWRFSTPFLRQSA